MSSTLKRAAGAVTRAPVGYWNGLTYPFKGVSFVFAKHPGLVKIWIFPILITLLVFCLGSWASWSFADEIISEWWAEPEGDGFFDGVARFFHSFVEVLLSLFMWVASIIVLLFLTSVIAAPFNGALSEAVERLATGCAESPGGLRVFARDIGRTIVLELVKLVLYLAVMVPLMILQCAVPGFGSVLYSIFAFVFTAWYWGLDYIDWPAERRGWKVGERFAHARANFMTLFGFGTGVWLFLFIPFVNLLFMPAAVAGGTLLYLDMVGPAPDSGGEDPVAPPAAH